MTAIQTAIKANHVRRWTISHGTINVLVHRVPHASPQKLNSTAHGIFIEHTRELRNLQTGIDNYWMKY